MNNKLEFADGTIIDGTAGYNGTHLFLFVDKETAITHLVDFMNPEKTETITFYYGAYKDIFHGFDQFLMISAPDGFGRMYVKLFGDGVLFEKKVPTVPVEYLPKE